MNKLDRLPGGAFFESFLPGYRRNASTFPERKIPKGYSIAERLDHTESRIPHATYFVLFPNTVGLPISERVSLSLLERYHREIVQAQLVHDGVSARRHLDLAWKSQQILDWTGAISFAAHAYALGERNQRERAQRIVREVSGVARAYNEFAPAYTVHSMQLNEHVVTVPATFLPYRS